MGRHGRPRADLDPAGSRASAHDRGTGADRRRGAAAGRRAGAPSVDRPPQSVRGPALLRPGGPAATDAAWRGAVRRVAGATGPGEPADHQRDRQRTAQHRVAFGVLSARALDIRPCPTPPTCPAVPWTTATSFARSWARARSAVSMRALTA